MRVAMLGLSITSSWGNGHATNYRGLVKALERRGHSVVFLERDVPWYAAHRDLPKPPHGRTELYRSLGELREQHADDIANADLVVLGSYVPDGISVAEWALGTTSGAVAFYDMDTPVTLSALERGECEYLVPELVPRFDVYLSFTGGLTLERLERQHGARRARAFYCFVDPEEHRPKERDECWALGYLGTHSADRQPGVERLLLEPARARPELRFAIAGPQFPQELDWPPNVDRVQHLPPAEHARFYAGQRFTVNVTRADMLRAGWSPSVRLFEAAACATPVISDWWEGLDSFFEPGREILVEHALQHLERLEPDESREIGKRARSRVLREHTADHRAAQLEAEVAALSRAAA
jgi:spore maturation protein CgeB